MDRSEALLAAVLALLVVGVISSPSLTGEITKITAKTGESDIWPTYVYIEPEQPFSFEAVTFGLAPVDPAATVTWDFGDGTGETGQIVEHVFGRQGTYNVKASVTVCRLQLLCETREFAREIEVLPDPFS